MRIDRYAGIGPQNMMYLLWSIFLDAREFFSQEVYAGDPLSESQLHSTTNCIGLGYIPVDTMGVPVDQFGLDYPSQQGKAISAASSMTGQGMFRPADYVPHQKKEVPDEISVLTNPLINKFPNIMTDALMPQHSSLKYEDI
jgi:hypothetical protein